MSAKERRTSARISSTRKDTEADDHNPLSFPASSSSSSSLQPPSSKHNTSAEPTASKAMPPPSLPPQTPTRALLNRIRRRSQVAPSSQQQPALPSTSSLLHHHHRPASQSLDLRRTSAHSVAAHDLGNEDDDDGDEHTALERQVDALLEAGESKDKIVADLKKNNAELRAELKMQKQLVEELKLSNKKRLNEQTLSNLEQEFHQQENILQGLQRDNEEKTIEIERVKRKDKVLTDYLLKLHGEDWPSIVSSAVGGASVLPVSALASSTSAPPPSADTSNSAVARVFAGAQSSRVLNTANLERGLSGSHNKRASLSLTGGLPPPPSTPARGSGLDREVHFSSSPSKMDGSNWGDASFVSAVDNSTFHLPPPPSLSRHDQETVNEEEEKDALSSENSGAGITLAEGTGTVSIQQLDVLRASIESTRLLVQGYLRSDATRRTKLDQMLEVAERRTREFEGVVSAH
ncbi:hypothetical protein CF327_g1993 [Tilletia walkeri]|nr:hypothetical protein CF327_g1993 [Tilletia walkeri]